MATRKPKSVPEVATDDQDEVDLDLSDDELDQISPMAGVRLIQLILDKIKDEDLTQRHFIDYVGLSFPYWRAILYGKRSFGAVKEHKLRKVADFLQIPPVQAFILAGKIESADFVVQASRQDELNSVSEHIRSDQRWMGLSLSKDEWAATPLKTQLLIAALYGEAKLQAFLSTPQI